MENIRIGTITRLGNSLAIVIPAAILRGLKIQRGDQVVFGVHSADIFAVRVLRPDELRKLKPEQISF